jgi:hypothetical protein
MLSEAKRKELAQLEAQLNARIRQLQSSLEKDAVDGMMAVEEMDVETNPQENVKKPLPEKEAAKASELEKLLSQRQEVRTLLTVDANYAEPITWLRKKHPDIAYQTRAMEETRFVDLSVEIGAQYLYCHKGDCEHVLVVENVRQYHQSIAYDTFPVLYYQSKIRRKKCFICKV